METFEVIIRRDDTRLLYRMKVEVIHRSVQVMRFKVTGRLSDKCMYLEKQLFRKSNQWKLAKQNFGYRGDVKANASAINEIIKEIEWHLAGRPTGYERNSKWDRK